MDETDPFGRSKDENPLAGLGWHEHDPTGAPAPQTEFNAAGRPSRSAGPEPAPAAGGEANELAAEPRQRRSHPQPARAGIPRPAKVLLGLL